MKALVLKEYNRLVFEEVPTPEPDSEEVQVSIKACGICGSDVHGMDGSTGRRRPPLIMGHEAAGGINQVGTQVSHWKPGDSVTFDSTIYCGKCEFCHRGEINLCDKRRVLGVSCDEYRQHGAFAEFVVVPQRILYELPKGLPFEHASLVEPFSIALHAIKRAGAKKNDAAVVLGAGMIGLGLAQLLSHVGCAPIIVVDVVDERLPLGQKCGATHVINSAKNQSIPSILALTRGFGADVVCEAVGVAATVDLALRCARKGGTVTLVGNVAPVIQFPLQTAVTRELNILGSCASRGEYQECLDLLARGVLKPAHLITAVAPLAEGMRWFDRLYRKEPGLLKVILKP